MVPADGALLTLPSSSFPFPQLMCIYTPICGGVRGAGPLGYSKKGWTTTIWPILSGHTPPLHFLRDVLAYTVESVVRRVGCPRNLARGGHEHASSQAAEGMLPPRRRTHHETAPVAGGGAGRSAWVWRRNPRSR